MTKVMGPYSAMHSRRTRILGLLVACLMLIPSSASANFRDALQAYANQDVAGMQAEIDDALERRDYDGVLIFYTVVRPRLSQQAATTWIDDKQRPSLLEKMSTAARQSGISSLIYQDFFYNNTKLLEQFPDIFESLAKNNYAYASYFLSRYYLDDFDGQQSYKKSLYWLKQAANQDFPIAQLKMAGIYLRLISINDELPIEQYYPYLSEDKQQGVAWLKRATKNYDRINTIFTGLGWNADHMRYFAYEMAHLFANNNAGLYNINEAQRWLRLAENSPGTYVDTQAKKLVASKTSSTEEPAASVLGNEDKSFLPTWIVEARQRDLNTEPLFTFKFSNTETGKPPAIQYWLDLYPDGKVYLGIPFEGDVTQNRELLRTVHQATINQFVTELNNLGFADWPAVYKTGTCIANDQLPFPCPSKSAYALLKNGQNQKWVYLQHLIGDTANSQRIEALHNLVIKYFDHPAIKLITGD